MKNRTWYILLAVFTLVIVALRVFALNPERVEAGYSTSFYVVLCDTVSRITSSFPFSLFELLIGALLLGAVALHFVWFGRWRKERWPFMQTALSILLRYAAAAMMLYTWFLVFWGLNYYRLPLAEKAGYPEARAGDAQYRAVAGWASLEIGRLYHETQGADAEQAVQMTLSALDAVLENAGEPAPGSGCVVKHFLLNGLLDASGTTGMLGPLTLEVHLNRSLFPEEIPFIAAHETAHLRGYTSEAEANLLAFEACLESGHPLARFSAFFHVFGYLCVPLSPDERKTLYLSWPEGVKDLVKRIDERRAQYEGLLMDAFQSVYDLYLRFNAVPEGIASYSRVGNWVAVLHHAEAEEALKK
jgi:hypothetical protein